MTYDRKRIVSMVCRDVADVALRRVVPVAVRWSDAEGAWFLDAYDVDVGADRSFAFSGILTWRGGES